MRIYQALVLGVVQGLTEFFPVSSSGHLILVPWLFGWAFFTTHTGLNKTFDVALHVGTFVGAFAYFRNDVARYLRAFGRVLATRRTATQDERVAVYLVAASVPGAAAGAFGEKIVEDHLGQPWLIAVLLIVFGLLLYVVDRVAANRRRMDEITLGDAIWMGVAQAIALSPGVSRSGATITAGRWRGLEREAAVRFSFLMSLPIIGGAGLYKGLKLAGTGLPSGLAAPFAAGMIASAITGFFAVAATLRLVKTRGFTVFVVYRMLAAAAVFAIIAAGVRSGG